MQRQTYRNKIHKRKYRHAPVLLLWCMLLLGAGCGNLYTGEEPLYDPNNPGGQGDQTQLPVMVAFSDPIYNVLTRGSGVLDPEDEESFNKHIYDGTFFVYAFRRDNPNGMTYAHRRAEDTDRRYCLIDGSLDGITDEECAALGITAEQSKEHGKRAAYAGNGSFVNWKSSGYIPYYNLQEEFDVFNFFAYYYDNAKIGEVKREADRICFDVTVDGSQDLMCASAADLKTLIEDVENGREVAADYSEQAARLKQLPADERQLMRSCYYGTYTARRNIWPIIRMKHQLSYVKLKFYPASQNPKEVVYITGVWIECVNKGVFTVASSDPAKVGVYFPADGEPGKLPSRDTEGNEKPWTDENGKSLYPIQVKEEDVDKDVSRRPATDGGVFLLPPGNNAKLLISTEYYPNETESEPYITTFSYDLKDAVHNKDENGAYLSSGFMGGREYSISAYIYGPQEIKLNVQAASWINGGDIEIGEEKE